MLFTVQIMGGSASRFNDKGWSGFPHVAMAVKNSHKFEAIN